MIFMITNPLLLYRFFFLVRSLLSNQQLHFLFLVFYYYCTIFIKSIWAYVTGGPQNSKINIAQTFLFALNSVEQMNGEHEMMMIARVKHQLRSVSIRFPCKCLGSINVLLNKFSLLV